MAIDSRRSSAYLALAALAVFVGVATEVWARSAGIDGYSGNPATNGGSICSSCHSGGVTPAVQLSGPTVVAPGTVHTYSLTISGGQEIAGGLDVSVTDGLLSAIDPGTYIRNGEIAHDSPRNAVGGEVTFTFDWIAPEMAGTTTMYGAGNSVNLANGNNGDAPNQDQLTITVAAVTPGETSGTGASPLLVTGIDRATGEISISFDSGCAATDNAIYSGSLSAVSSYAWSGRLCGIGTGGSVSAFNPGPGSYFFVIVGNAGIDEGSYGVSQQGGVTSERPPFNFNGCGKAQNLTDRCD